MTARILVVDDVPANVKLLEARLSAEYYEVVTASNGYEALEFCENNSVDVILLDVMMPGMDGFEVCRRLKSQPATAHIPVILVTALDQDMDRIDPAPGRRYAVGSNAACWHGDPHRRSLGQNNRYR